MTKLFPLSHYSQHVIHCHKHIMLAYMEPIIQPRFQGAIRIKRNNWPFYALRKGQKAWFVRQNTELMIQHVRMRPCRLFKNSHASMYQMDKKK